MRHPYGVLPESQDEQCKLLRCKGLGTLSRFTDEVIVNILHYLNAAELCRLSTTSRALYIFCNDDTVWKGLSLQNLQPNWKFHKTWQETYLRHTVPSYTPNSKKPRILPGNPLCSELLYQPWLYSIVDIDPAWLEIETIERRSGLSKEDFREQYEIPNKPVILTNIATQWPAARKWLEDDYLFQAFQDKHVIVGDAPMRYDSFLDYCKDNNDEMPLYLFDKTFITNCPALQNDYTVPPHFSDDLFSVLGEDGRPDYRWLIIGPKRSGSTFHKDPNATSAWNAVIKGSKKWLLYPPHVQPPGVRASADGADVACPVSLMEWFIHFYPHKEVVGYLPVECTVQAGEILFVPRGWWHVALNLEDSIAITHNYVSATNLPYVLTFLATRNPALVSGLESDEERVALYDTFTTALKEKHSDVLEMALEEMEQWKKRAKVGFFCFCFVLNVLFCIGMFLLSSFTVKGSYFVGPTEHMYSTLNLMSHYPMMVY